MGVCCSKAAKPITSTSSSRHYVSVFSSPSSFPTESEYKQDSAVVSHVGETFSCSENTVERATVKDSKEERSTRGYFETDADPMRVDLCEETANQTKKESLEYSSSQSVLNDGIPAAESNVLKSSNPVVRPRPSKEGNDLEPDKKTNGESSPDALPTPKSIYVTRRTKKQLSKDNQEGDLPSSPSVSPSKKNLSQDVMIEEKKSGSSEPTPPSDGAAPKSKRKARKKPKRRSTTEQEIKEIHLNTTTASNPSQMHSDSRASLETEKLPIKDTQCGKGITRDEKLEEDIDHALNDDVGTNASNIKASSGGVSPTKRVPRRKESSTSVKDKVNDRELEEVIAYIFSDDFDKAESSGKISNATVPPSKKTQRHKKNSKKELNNIPSEGVSTGDVNGEISSGKDSPTKRTQHPSKYSMRQTQSAIDEELGKDIDFILNDNASTGESNHQIVPGTVSPTNSTQHSKRYSTKDKTKVNDKKLPEDDKMEMSARNTKDDFANKQKNMDEKELPKGMGSFLKGGVLSNDSEQESSSVAVSPMTKPQRLKNHSISEKETMNDQKLEDDIAYILNDEITTAESNLREVSSGTVPPKRKVRSPRKSSAREKKGTNDKTLAEFNSQIASGDVSPKKRVAFQEANKADDKLAKDIEYILKEDIVEDVPTMKYRKQADELEKDTQFILTDDIFAVKSNDDVISSSPSEIPRPKTSNPKLSLAMDMDRIFDPASVASPTAADDELEENIAYILSDDLVDFASCSRSKGKTSTRKLTKNKAPSTNRNSTVKPKVTIIEDVDSSAHIYFDSGYSVVPRSPENSSCKQKHAKIGEKNDDKLMDTRNKASIESIASSSNDGTPLKMKRSTRLPWKAEKVNWEEAINKILEMSEVNSDALGENISDGGTRLRNEKATRQPKQCNHTEEVNLEEAISEILEIPVNDSRENPSDVRTRVRKEKAKRQANRFKRIEDINLDEAINEILDIPITNSGASRKVRTASGTSSKKNSARQPKLSKNAEEVNLEEVINDIIPTRESDSKKAVKLDTTSKESKTKLKKRVDMFESRGTDTKPSTAHTLADKDVRNVKFPDAKASSSSIETKNCGSGTSLGSGNNMRPMTARVSRIASVGCSTSPDTVKLPSSNITRQVSKRRQTLPAILKKETTVPKPRMAARRETAVPSLGSVKSMATQRKPAVPVTGLSSHRTAAGITYESDEVMLMEQIEKESLRL